MPPYEPNSLECTCPEVVEEEGTGTYDSDDDTSDDSELDLDWEVHFTSPFAYHE